MPTASNHQAGQRPKRSQNSAAPVASFTRLWEPSNWTCHMLRGVARETGLANAGGIEKPTPEQLARLDRKRKKKTSNKEWKSPADPDARIAKMKDGRTHLAHKAEHAVDLNSAHSLR